MICSSARLKGDAGCDQVHLEIKPHHVTVGQSRARSVPFSQDRVAVFGVNYTYEKRCREIGFRRYFRITLLGVVDRQKAGSLHRITGLLDPLLSLVQG
ncbi:hypothetical protein [Chloroflexus sp.]|uniref:hypothetical protein n=1 Tax=Chloroflexus sp. TaxID=1904827 RepID=UPI00404992E4